MLVSALAFGGPPGRVLQQAIDGRLELVLPVPVLAELKRILRVKFSYDAARWAEVEALLGDIARERPEAPAQPVEAITGDPDDDIVLACAVAARVEVLASGDRRHLLPVGEYHGVRIITPQALLAELHHQ